MDLRENYPITFLKCYIYFIRETELKYLKRPNFRKYRINSGCEFSGEKQNGNKKSPGFALTKSNLFVNPVDKIKLSCIKTRLH